MAWDWDWDWKKGKGTQDERLTGNQRLAVSGNETSSGKSESLVLIYGVEELDCQEAKRSLQPTNDTTTQ